MEHEKKKRQKKKKNKQGKANESVSAGAGELASENNATLRNHQITNSENADVQNRSVQQTVVDSDRESVNGAETTEKSNWSKKEVSLELKIKELQEQLDVQLRKEADVERNILQSQKERGLWHDKQTELEKRILQLQTEKDNWLQKEAGYEEKVNRLVEEAATLRSMGASFEEKRILMEEEKVNLAHRENSATETIASLNKDNAKLRAQVIELESSRNDIYHQNLQLKEHVSKLQSKIQDLENSVSTNLSSEMTKHVAEYEDMKSQLESAQALVAKLLSENEKLVEKVNILNLKLDEKSVTTQSSLPNNPDDDPMIQNSKAADIQETSAPNTDSVSNVGPPPSDKFVNHVTSEGSDMNQTSQTSMESGEIVQISLDENDVTVATPATSVPENLDPVPLTDAPLIGAPFRLISFVARYVSGADLVQK